MQLRLELLLQATQAFVVHAHIAQHLRGNLIIRVESLKFLLYVDAPVDAREAWVIWNEFVLIRGARIDQRMNAGGHLRRNPPGDPCKVARRVQVCGNLLLGGLRVVGVGVDNCGQRMGGRQLIRDLVGHGEDGVHLHRHGQLAQVAVIEHAAARSHVEGALLLLPGALLEFAVKHHLKPEEANGNQNGPEEKEQADKPKTHPLERHHARRGIVIPAGSNGGRHKQSLR